MFSFLSPSRATIYIIIRSGLIWIRVREKRERSQELMKKRFASSSSNELQSSNSHRVAQIDYTEDVMEAISSSWPCVPTRTTTIKEIFRDRNNLLILSPCWMHLPCRTRSRLCDNGCGAKLCHRRCRITLAPSNGYKLINDEWGSTRYNGIRPSTACLLKRQDTFFFWAQTSSLFSTKRTAQALEEFLESNAASTNGTSRTNRRANVSDKIGRKKREMRGKQVSWRKKGLSRTCPQIEVQLLQYVGTRLDCGPEKESPSGSWE